MSVDWVFCHGELLKCQFVVYILRMLQVLVYDFQYNLHVMCCINCFLQATIAGVFS